MKSLIKKILKEEDESKIKRLIETVVKDIILPTYKHIICDIEVIAPSERKAADPNYVYEEFRLTVIAIGGYGTRYWPQTTSIRDMYDELMTEIWHIIYEYTGGKTVDLYIRKIGKDECEEISKKTNIVENDNKESMKTLDEINFDRFNKFSKILLSLIKKEYPFVKQIITNEMLLNGYNYNFYIELTVDSAKVKDFYGYDYKDFFKTNAGKEHYVLGTYSVISIILETDESFDSLIETKKIEDTLKDFYELIPDEYKILREEEFSAIFKYKNLYLDGFKFVV